MIRASFAAHVQSRTQTLDIFRQMTDLPVHVILGGGTRLFEVIQERDGIDLRAAMAGAVHVRGDRPGAS